jgi:hypothetical protein
MAVWPLALFVVFGGRVDAQEASLYIGPNTRGKFVDMDAGIRDSIQDIRRQAANVFRVVLLPEANATLKLIVLGRGRITQGSVGFASAASGFGFVVPNDTPTLVTVLRVGEYERVSERGRHMDGCSECGR